MSSTHGTKIFSLDTKTRKQAIDWILDCSWLDIDDREDLEILNDYELSLGINKHYAGGLQQFIRDGQGA